MSTATAHFAGLPELVDYVAHDAFHARNIDVLDNMRLVSKTFSAAATPYRFSELRIRHTIAKAPLTGKPGLAPFLVHVRHAVFSSFKGLPDEEEPLQRIFAQMPRLESVRYDGIPMTPAFLRALTESCPRLQLVELDLRVHEEYSFTTERRPSRDYRQDLGGFRDLRGMTLHGLPSDDFDWWIPQIVRLLRDSPRLKRLAVGFNRLPSPSDASLYESKMAASMHAWDDLCDLFGSEGCPPLRLESLWLMGRLYPLRLSSLKKLTDLSHLGDIYLSNASPPWPSSSDEPELDLAALAAFAPPHTPNLRRFRVDRYSQAVHEHLSSISDDHPSFTRNLGIFYRRPHSLHTGPDPAALFRPHPAHPHLPLPVRMMDLDLHRAPIRRHNGTDLSISADQVLSDLASTSADSLEGLAVRIPGAPHTVSERPRPGEEEQGNEATEACLQSLERVLGRFRKLTQLSVAWQGPGDQGTAERLALAGPSIRFIQIYLVLWRVWRNDDGTVRLETVKRIEATRVELWRYSMFVDWPMNTWHLRQ